MTWYNSLSDTARASMASGLTNPNTVDNTLNAWDLQKINYDAPGADGWVNSTVGMFQSLNPFAISQTYNSIYNETAKENPDDTAFNNTWNALWGTAGAGLGNIFTGSAHTLLRPAVSTALTAAAGARALQDAGTGRQSRWDEDINNAWDLSKSGKIGIGDALTYAKQESGKALGNAVLGTDEGKTALGDTKVTPDQKKFDKNGDGVISDDERITYQKALSDWGINTLSDDFDVFDTAQREAAYNNGSVGSTINQVTNFAGEMVLNPLNFIPAGAIVGKVNIARRGLSEASNIGNTIIAERTALAAAANGEKSAASANLRFFAKNNADTIGQSRMAKEIAGDKRDAWTSLMGRVDNEADAAKVELAMFHGSKKSVLDLYKKYGNDPEFALTLDAQHAGGYFARAADDPTSALMTGGVDNNAEIARITQTILDRPDMSDFARILKNGAWDVGPDGAPQIVANGLRTSTLKNGKIFGIADNVIDFTGAHIRNWNRLGEGTPAGIVTLATRGPKIFSVVRRGGITAARDLIQTDGNVNQTEKFIGYVDDMFNFSRPRIGKINAQQEAEELAQRQAFVDKWRTASSSGDRATVLGQVEDYGWARLGAKHGIDGDATRMISAHVKLRNQQLMKSIRESDRNHAVVLDADGNGMVYHDPLLGSSTGEQAYLVNWNKGDKYLTSRGKNNLNKAALQILPDQTKIAPTDAPKGAFGGLGAAHYNTANALAGAVNEGQAIWSAVTLTRLARLTREPITTLAPLAIIGKLPAMIQESIRDDIKLGANKLMTYGDRKINGSISDLNQEIAEIGAVKTELKAKQDLLTANQLSPETVFPAQRIQLERTRIQNETKTLLYHGSPDKLPDVLEPGRPMTFSQNLDDANDYMRGYGDIPTIDYNPKLARNAEAARQKWLAAQESTRNGEAVYKSTQEDFLKAQAAQDDRLSLQELARAVETSRAKLATASDEELSTIEGNIAASQQMMESIMGRIGDAPDLAMAEIRTEAARAAHASAMSAERKAAANHAKALREHQTSKEAGLPELHAKLKGAADEGKTIRLMPRNGKNFTVYSYDKAEALGGRIGNYKINVIKASQIPTEKAPWVKGVNVYGKSLEIPTGGKMPAELRDALGLKDAKQVAGWIKREGWKDADGAFVKWAEKNEVGKFVFKQGDKNTVVAIPKFIETPDYNPVEAIAAERVRREVDDVMVRTRAAAAARGLSPEKELRRAQVRSLFEGEPQDFAQYEAQMTGLANDHAVATARLNNLKERLARREGRIVSDPRLGPNYKINVDGEDFGKFDAPREGQVFAGLNSAEGAANTLLGSGISDVEAGKFAMRPLHPHAVYDAKGTIVQNASPKYMAGWAGVIETKLANDIPFRMVVAGDDAGLDTFLASAAGKELMRTKGIGQAESSINHIAANGGEGLTKEQYVEQLHEFADTYFPQGTQDLRQKFLNGEPISESYLAKNYADNPNLKPLDGWVFDDVRQDRAHTIASAVKHAQQKFLDVVVTKPQNVLANAPFARVTYREALERSIAGHRAENGARAITVAERNAMETQARRTAIQETKKWIYNVTDRSNFEESAAYFSRFISAYMFSVRQAKNLAVEYPVQAAWIANGIGGLPGVVPMYDKTGERTNDFNKASKIVVPLDKGLVDELTKLPVIGDWIKDADLQQTHEIRLSRASVDPWFGGDFLPGGGPLVSIPLNIAGKVSPEGLSTVNDMTKFIPAITGDDRGLIDFLQPYGINQGGAPEQVLPAYFVAGLTALTNGDPNSQGVGHALYNQTLAETALSVMSDYDEHPENFDHKPTMKEIEKKTKSLFWLKAFSGFTLPTSVTPTTDFDFAAEQWKRYKKAGGTAYGFAKEHPELAFAETNILSGKYNIPTSDKSVMKLKENPELPEWAINNGDASEDFMAFALGATDADYQEYDKGASGWLANNGPGDGSTYSAALTPQQAIQKENVSRGWSEYWRRIGLINGYASENGLVVENSPVLKQAKKQLVDEMTADPKFKDWNDAYNVRDGGTYTKRARALEELYASDWYDKNKDRKDVQAMRSYLDLRSDAIDQLNQRQAQGYSGELDSDDNVDLRTQFYANVQKLENGNVNFSDVYQQRFVNETIKG